MKKLGDALLVLAIIAVLGALADTVGLTQMIPRGFGVHPGGYLKLAMTLILLNIAITLREKK